MPAKARDPDAKNPPGRAGGLDLKPRCELWTSAKAFQPAGLRNGPTADAGAVVSGAPPSDLGLSDLIERAKRLRASPDSRARARPFGIDEVISDVACCSESTFAMSVESCADIVFTSDCSSVRLDLRVSSLVASCCSRALFCCNKDPLSCSKAMFRCNEDPLSSSKAVFRCNEDPLSSSKAVLCCNDDPLPCNAVA